jgi:DNA-binding response OmpR family regulator
MAADDRSARPIEVTARSASSGLPIKLAKALRVLVVEDDAMIGVLLGEMLEDMGYDVCGIEATEADAVTAAARCRPDLMIVDVHLGAGSGVSAIDEIHRAGPVPHVFVSGDIARIRALRPGSIAIQKPYRESELALVIQRALESASAS